MPNRRVIRHELLHTDRRGRQGRAGFAHSGMNCAMGQELRYLLSDRKRMRRPHPPAPGMAFGNSPQTRGPHCRQTRGRARFS